MPSSKTVSTKQVKIITVKHRKLRASISNASKQIDVIRRTLEKATEQTKIQVQEMTESLNMKHNQRGAFCAANKLAIKLGACQSKLDKLERFKEKFERFNNTFEPKKDLFYKHDRALKHTVIPFFSQE